MQMAMLIAAYLTWLGGAWWGGITAKQSMCSEMMQAYYESPAGCGGSLDGCPVEASAEHQIIVDACADVDWHIITENVVPARQLPPYVPLTSRPSVHS